MRRLIAALLADPGFNSQNLFDTAAMTVCNSSSWGIQAHSLHSQYWSDILKYIHFQRKELESWMVAKPHLEKKKTAWRNRYLTGNWDGQETWEERFGSKLSEGGQFSLGWPWLVPKPAPIFTWTIFRLPHISPSSQDTRNTVFTVGWAWKMWLGTVSDNFGSYCGNPWLKASSSCKES